MSASAKTILSSPAWRESSNSRADARGAPGFPGIGIGGGPVGMPGQIVLVAGKHESIPTSYSGSVRLRALTGKHFPAGMPKAEGYNILFDAAAEPRLQGFQLVGNPVITKAVDDQGQTLTPSADLPKVEGPMGGPDGVMILRARRATRPCMRRKPYQRRRVSLRHGLRVCERSMRRSKVIGWWIVVTSGRPIFSISSIP